MNTNSPSLRGYPIDARLRDHRGVVPPLHTTVRRWIRRAARVG